MAVLVLCGSLAACGNADAGAPGWDDDGPLAQAGSQHTTLPTHSRVLAYGQAIVRNTTPFPIRIRSARPLDVTPGLDPVGSYALAAPPSPDGWRVLFPGYRPPPRASAVAGFEIRPGGYLQVVFGFRARRPGEYLVAAAGLEYETFGRVYRDRLRSSMLACVLPPGTPVVRPCPDPGR